MFQVHPTTIPCVSPELLLQLLNTTDCAAVMLDDARVIRYSNEVVANLFGYAPDELIGRPIDVLLPHAAVDVEQNMGHVNRAATRSAPTTQRRSMLARRRDGDTFMSMVVVSSIHQDSHPWSAVIINDVSHVVDAQNALRDKTHAIALMEERSRLARVFQDITTQTLFSAKISAEVLPTAIQRDPELAIRMAEAISQMATGAMAQLRVVLVELLAGEIAANPIESLVQVLANASAARIGKNIAVVSRVRGQPPGNVRSALYRVAQEALHNAATHSVAEHISVDLNVGSRQALLTVTDDGRGAPLERLERSPTGIRAMRDQAALIDAHLDIWSAVGQGTRVTLCWGEV
jgi:PAS domain S-box-containing protein